MLPPLNQTPTDARVDAESHSNGPSRESLLRSAATRPPGQGPRSSPPLSARRTPVASKPVAGSTTASPRRVSTYKPSPPPRASTDVPCTPQPLPLDHGATAIEALSRIPREFFVVETNAVLPQMQYPPTMYQSTFVGSGTWETVVFPALTPHTRQQVLYLRQTLEKMRTQAGSSAGLVATATKAVEYTEKEWLLHSLCFHELARQIKFICKEQSELLYEIQAAYDASQARLVTLVRQLQAENGKRLMEIHALTEMQKQQHDANEQQRLQLEAAASSAAAVAASSSCSCRRRRRRRREDAGAGESDDGTESDDDKSFGDESDEDEQQLWREFRRQRRMQLRKLVGGDDDGEESGGRRHQRASVVEENMAAARVQQAFAKYQHRKEAHRALQREEKLLAVLDIQRSYRGYRERQRALHKRAVMQTILRRRQQVAAVELLQMNVRAYLIKKRREAKYQPREPVNAAAQASMLEAQRAAAAARTPATGVGNLPALLERAASVKGIPKDDLDAETTDSAPDERITHLMAGLSELAASFSFLHSRRRNAKRVKKAMASRQMGTSTTSVSEGGEEDELPEVASVAVVLSDGQADAAAELGVEAQGDEQQDAKEDLDQLLLTETIRQAEGLIHSFRSVICDLKRDAASEWLDDELTKSTSTTTLMPVSEDDAGADGSFPGGVDPASFLFVDDSEPKRNRHGGGSPFSSPRGLRVGGAGASVSDAATIVDEDDSDDTHLDDVLWQTAVYTPRSANQSEEETATRRNLLRELQASRDLQKRLVGLKQFIADIYDTVVGKLSELKPARLEKLVQIHASLALSFSDGQRLLRGRDHYKPATQQHASTACSSSEYEPASAFVGRLDMHDLIRDHFHCQVGIKHLVDASMERLVTDLHAFLPLDPDVQRFHEYLTHERSLDELVFFCLCRLYARTNATHQQSRQPVFHGATMRELIDLPHAMAVATALFYAGGKDAELLESDAFIIEPSNEIYTRHLPSKGLEQLEVILRDYVTSVDTQEVGVGCDGDHYSIDPGSFVRATNANQFHAKEYNANAPRSPILRKNAPRTTFVYGSTGGAVSLSSSSSTSWIYFDELVELLKRYRSIMRHFHAFIRWTYELFHDAYRRQKQQQSLDTSSSVRPASGSSSSSQLLEEAAFVETLLPFSLGTNERELRNVFHNALKQRHLQRLMPVRVFVSVVLVLLRNGLLSVTSYAPLQKASESLAASTRPSTQGSYGTSHRQKREEKQWMQIALQWRGQEQRFEAAVERIYAASAVSTADSELPTDGNAAASQLLAWRNELYELFMSRSGRQSLERAQTLFELLTEALQDETQDRPAAVAEMKPQSVDSSSRVAAADAVGSPWEESEMW